MICHEMDGVIDSYHSDHCQIYERKCEEFHQQSGFVPTGLACAVPAASSDLVTLAARSHSLSRLDGRNCGWIGRACWSDGARGALPQLGWVSILVWHWGVTMLATLGSLPHGCLPSRRA